MKNMKGRRKEKRQTRKAAMEARQRLEGKTKSKGIAQNTKYC